MVPESPSLGRRRLLGALAGVAAGGAVAVGATEPTALPDPVTDAATKLYPTPPELRSLWRPTVTEAHAAEAVDLLAETVSRGERLWARLDTDESFLGAGGWLESARTALRNGNYDEALFDATYGMQFAGESLGVARARLGEADLPALAERGRALLDRADRVARGLRPYPAVEPPRDLAWYYRIERELVFGRRHAAWHGMEAARDGLDDANGPDASVYDPREVGSITAGLLEAELYVRNAERYAERLSSTLADGGAALDAFGAGGDDAASAGDSDDAAGGDAVAYADHLARTVDRFRAEIESFPSMGEVRDRYVRNRGDEPYGPYEFAHSRLARWCFGTDYAFGRGENTDLLAHRAVELSTGLAQRRAHGVAVDRLVVEDGDEGFDSGHALAAKRRARATYRSVVGSNPPPLLTQQVDRAVEDLQVAKVGFGGHSQRPLWRERLKAYLYALVGRAKLQQYPALHDALVSRE